MDEDRLTKISWSCLNDEEKRVTKIIVGSMSVFFAVFIAVNMYIFKVLM